jgi:hypothetical protein
MPFAPWCGKEYWNAKTRILFVGKSVGAFNDPDAEDWKIPLSEWQNARNRKNPSSVTDQYIHKVATFEPGKHAFWTVPLLLTGAFASRDLRPAQLVQTFVWSNLYKINSSEKEGLPSADLKCRGQNKREGKCDKKFCLFHFSLKSLLAEIEILEPHFVFLGTGPEWARIAKARSLDPKGERAALPLKLSDTEVNGLGLSQAPRGIWVTYHFSAWNQNCCHGKLLLEMRQSLEIS